jgi:hypothetical protein
MLPQQVPEIGGGLMRRGDGQEHSLVVAENMGGEDF